MKKLLVYLRPYRLQAILAPVFKLLEAAFELLVPLIMADIIDVGIAAGDTGYILKKCLLLVGLGLCGFASATCAQYFSAKAATGATASLRHALFAHIQSLSYAELDTIGPATLVTRMTSDMNQVQTGLNLTLRLLLRSPIVVFGSMIMAFTIDVRSALIFVVTIPVLFAIVLCHHAQLHPALPPGAGEARRRDGRGAGEPVRRARHPRLYPRADRDGEL